MTDLVSAAQFLGLVTLVVGVVLVPAQPTVRRQRAVTVLIAYIVAMSVGNALWRNADLWPFSPWGLTAFRAPRNTQETGVLLRVTGATADGREYRIDPRAFAPIGGHELAAWMGTAFPDLSAAQQARVGALQLRQINEARVDALSGRVPGGEHRFLGPLTAPGHQLYVRPWTAADMPTAPFVSIRWYREEWDVLERWHNPDRLVLHRWYAFGPDR